MTSVDGKPSVMLMSIRLASTMRLPLDLRVRCLRFTMWLRAKDPTILDDMLLALPADNRFTVEDLLLSYVL